MTIDEVKAVMARALCDSDGEFDDPTDSIVRDWWIGEADRALAALAGDGLVIGKPENVDIEVDTRKSEIVLPVGLALVRVVT